MEFDGRTILISGAGRANSQGAAEARHLVAAGARVLIGDFCDEGIDVASDLGERCRYVRLDVTKEEDWMEALAAAKQ